MKVLDPFVSSDRLRPSTKSTSAQEQPEKYCFPHLFTCTCAPVCAVLLLLLSLWFARSQEHVRLAALQESFRQTSYPIRCWARYK